MPLFYACLVSCIYIERYSVLSVHAWHVTDLDSYDYLP